MGTGFKWQAQIGTTQWHSHMTMDLSIIRAACFKPTRALKLERITGFTTGFLKASHVTNAPCNGRGRAPTVAFRIPMRTNVTFSTWKASVGTRPIGALAHAHIMANAPQTRDHRPPAERSLQIVLMLQWSMKEQTVALEEVRRLLLRPHHLLHYPQLVQ